MRLNDLLRRMFVFLCSVLIPLLHLDLTYEENISVNRLHKNKSYSVKWYIYIYYIYLRNSSSQENLITPSFSCLNKSIMIKVVL